MPYPLHLRPSEEAIRGYLSLSLENLTVRVYDRLDSTNTEARRLLAARVKTPLLLVAHAQTAGKGRLGRSFYSPEGDGVYLSLVFTVDRIPEDGGRVTPAAAVAVAEAIETVCGKRADIKWVNDLYISGRKVCGILTEAVIAEECCHIIVGIGINVTTRNFPDGMRHPAGAVLEAGDPLADQSLLCARVTEGLLDDLRPEQADACLARYRRRLMMVGQPVICSRNFALDGTPDPALSVQGTVVGVDDRYGLILRLADGTETVLRGGEISVRQRKL